MTRALSIKVTRSKASQAADIANAFATQYLDYRYTKANRQARTARRDISQQLSVCRTSSHA